MTLVLTITEEEIRAWIRAKAKEALGVEIEDACLLLMVKTYYRQKGDFEIATRYHVQCVVER